MKKLMDRIRRFFKHQPKEFEYDIPWHERTLFDTEVDYTRSPGDVIYYKDMYLMVDKSMKGGIIFTLYITHKQLKKDGYVFIGRSCQEAYEDKER